MFLGFFPNFSCQPRLITEKLGQRQVASGKEIRVSEIFHGQGQMPILKDATRFEKKISMTDILLDFWTSWMGTFGTLMISRQMGHL